MRETVDYDINLSLLESTPVAAKPLMIHLLLSVKSTEDEFSWLKTEDQGLSACICTSPNVLRLPLMLAYELSLRTKKGLWFPSCQVELLLLVAEKKNTKF